MPPREGLPGLDTSLAFSADPLHHLFIVINGIGDPYVDHPPWMSSLESSLKQLNRNYGLVSQYYEKAQRRRAINSSAPSVLFVPVEWHRPAFETWQAEVRLAEPNPSLAGPATVREAVAETVGDVLLMASPFWRKTIARHVAGQIEAQMKAVRRNRPNFTGRVSLIAHSVGAMLALELIQRELLGDVKLDAVVLTGCPVAAYAALAPDGGHQAALATIRERNGDIRFVNVYHPLDPVSYRLEPFVLDGETQEAVKVTPQKRTFWDDASMFWDDIVYNLWSTLFPERERGRTKGIADLFAMFGGNQRGAALDDEGVVSEVKRTSSHITEETEGGSAVLLEDRVDYELQDGMGVPPLDVMASWGAIKAHTYYWQSIDVARIFFDIATAPPLSRSAVVSDESEAQGAKE